MKFWRGLQLMRNVAKVGELCVPVCPKKILGFRNGSIVKAIILSKTIGTDCIGCAFCARICPDVVIEVYK